MYAPRSGNESLARRLSSLGLYRKFWGLRFVRLRVPRNLRRLRKVMFELAVGFLPVYW